MGGCVVRNYFVLFAVLILEGYFKGVTCPAEDVQRFFRASTRHVWFHGARFARRHGGFVPRITSSGFVRTSPSFLAGRSAFRIQHPSRTVQSLGVVVLPSPEENARCITFGNGEERGVEMRREEIGSERHIYFSDRLCGPAHGLHGRFFITKHLEFFEMFSYEGYLFERVILFSGHEYHYL